MSCSAHVCILLCRFCTLLLVFWQLWYEKGVSFVLCCLVILFAHSYGSDFVLFDQMSYGAHVCTFYVIFHIVFWYFSTVCNYIVFCYVICSWVSLSSPCIIFWINILSKCYIERIFSVLISLYSYKWNIWYYDLVS